MSAGGLAFAATTRGLLFAGAIVAAAACGDKKEQPAPEQTTAPVEPGAAEPQKEPAPPPGTGTGTIEGVVRLAAGAELPSYSSEGMEKKILEHTKHAALPETCTPPKTTDRQPVQATPEGYLTNVVLAASEFSKQPQRPQMTHDVVIEDCRLTPAIVVAMKGDTLRVRNALNYPFMPTYGPNPVVRTLIMGQTYEVTLDNPGVAPLLCGFTAPCGRTDVVVMMHPLHTTTDAQGKFKLENFPAGETVKLSAWHPLVQESAIEVKLEPGEVKRVELTLTPVPGSATAEPEGDATQQPAQGKAKRGSKGEKAAAR